MLGVTRATPADHPAIVALRCALWPPDADDDPDIHREDQRAELAALAQRPSFAVFIARDGDAAVGFVEATLREYLDGADPGPPAAFLEGLYVVPAARRRGVARALHAAVVAWARAHGCAALGSDADLDNDASHAWHRALGFDETGRTVNFVGAIENRDNPAMN